MGGGTPGGVMGGILGGIGNGPAIVKAAPPKKLSISSGVMAGQPAPKDRPAIPGDRQGGPHSGDRSFAGDDFQDWRIENLRVVSGPPMLQQAALDAVRSWRYRPYLLNGEPVEVETTVNVVFNLGG